MAGSTIYNSTDGPLLIDGVGRVLGARERREDVDVTASPVAGHIKAGRIVVIDEPQEDAPTEAAAQDVEAKPAGKARRTPAPTHEEA